MHIALFLLTFASRQLKKLLDTSASTLAAVHSKGIEAEASKVHYIPFPGFFSLSMTYDTRFFYRRHE